MHLTCIITRMATSLPAPTCNRLASALSLSACALSPDSTALCAAACRLPSAAAFSRRCWSSARRALCLRMQPAGSQPVDHGTYALPSQNPGAFAKYQGIEQPTAIQLDTQRNNGYLWDVHLHSAASASSTTWVMAYWAPEAWGTAALLPA